MNNHDSAGYHHDMHCHLSFAANGSELMREARRCGLLALSATVTPDDYRRACEELVDGADEDALMRVGLGMHPWWVSEDVQENRRMLADFLELLPHAAAVGEIGLDRAPRHAETFDQQQRMMGAIAIALQSQPSRAVSIHCIRAYPEMFALLDQAELWDLHRIIFHWFSGSSDDLVAARTRGAFFSVNARMLATKRGRAYVQAMPLESLLIETDEPAEHAGVWPFEVWCKQLTDVLHTLAHVRMIPAGTLSELLYANAQRVLCA